MVERIVSTFKDRFGSDPFVFRAPGRVNLIGEHTDYNNGFVMPAAINRYAYFAIKPNGLGLYRFHAADFRRDFTTPVYKIEPSNAHWTNYLLGVIAQMVAEGKDIPGFDCVFGGDVPIGAGMSSSAAIESGLAFALNHIYGLGFTRMQLAQIAQRAEHEYAGVKCGIMDQFASLHGKQNHVLLLDCRSLEFEPFELNMDNHSIILVNTGVKHSLASSEYNKRRQECQAGVDILKKYNNSIQSLRDVTINDLNNHKREFSSKVWERCLYVVEENQRVVNAGKALTQKDFESFGKLMYQSHYGLRDMYEVSCPELDKLVELTEKLDYVVGSRMMGGGFGGCTINVVKNAHIDEFTKCVKENYKTPDGKIPQIITCVISNGAELLVY
ncbi:MAG: galactokinase [Tenuifilum sp.]|uniref:galactokinase n=1 Tax=Tenuifilum sp. TaxID=2760880 RepID=UPI001B450C9D|nr:galactokinase [Bacteroidales bacterium]HOK61431.1 galactokinase [Tenuifilum sp.]MBP9028686.1 galactokinase [Bacteroidales bacterium]HOK86131.1 galactokinase [Tenuifilum sp.]HON70021.1 galactokinase [Tenuifilum sp.]